MWLVRVFDPSGWFDTLKRPSCWWGVQHGRLLVLARHAYARINVGITPSAAYTRRAWLSPGVRHSSNVVNLRFQ